VIDARTRIYGFPAVSRIIERFSRPTSRNLRFESQLEDLMNAGAFPAFKSQMSNLKSLFFMKAVDCWTDGQGRTDGRRTASTLNCQQLRVKLTGLMFGN
jgi:hypothetical protein